MIPGRANAVVALLACLAAASCTWREGRSVYIVIYDADSDADAEADADESRETGDVECGAGEVVWLQAEELLTLIAADTPDLVIVDIRPVESCQAGHIPGALCDSWDGETFAEPLTELDDRGWLVLYDGNGETVEAAAASLTTYCVRTVALIISGFGSWEAAGFDVEFGEP